jgi:succinate dehydrogenase hydrophobic anchor subunit
MKKNVISLIRVSGVILMFYIVINFYFFLFVAMSQGNGVVTVYFNRLNEGMLETILYIIVAPLIVISFILELLLYNKERRIRIGEKEKVI